MAASEIDAFHDRARSHWVRLRTLVVLRWFAIAGQTAAILAAVFLFDLTFNVGMVSLAIGVSVLANLFSTFLIPESKRLSEVEALLMLLFDLMQLGLLLTLTGGLNNPFALLILAPVTIAATFLHLRSTLFLAATSVIIATLLGWFHLPLGLEDGSIIAMPPISLFGFWVAIVIGVGFLTLYARQVTGELHAMGDALFAVQTALAREQKLTDLGGVVAAAAHELGTPLATIKLVSSELLREHNDTSDLAEDLRLIAEQTDRCRDILRSMGQAGKEDRHLLRAPLEAVLKEAAEPHLRRGKSVNFKVSAETEFPNHQPVIQRRPEIIHGLRNLIQNAVDFAASTVQVESTWTGDKVVLRIVDDGMGFPPSVLGRLGNPFLRRRTGTESRNARPGYEGMGLGLFIAKTLLERSGAKVSFSNGGGKVTGTGATGAIVTVEWPRDAVDPSQDRGFGPLGNNAPFGS